MTFLAFALLLRLSSAWNCSYEALASLPSDLVKNSLDIDKLAGEWQIQSWWKRQQGHGDSSSEQELNEMRRNWMWRFAFVGCVISMCRLVSRQVRRHDENGFGAELDLNLLVATTCSLLVTSFPWLTNPRRQDIVYVVIMLCLDASFLIPPVEVDVRDVIALSFPGRFIFAVLTRRTSAAAFCMLLHLIQAIQIVRLQGLQEASAGTAYSIQALDSGQLSSMLLQTAPKVGGLAGKSLLDFFTEGDRQRISEQVLNPVESVSVVALNADMLDSDFNHVKVELFCTQFKNLASERCFLVGLRELQDMEPRALGAQVPRRPSNLSVAGNEAFIVVFGLHSFDDNILDIASQDTRLSLCRQLQQLGNAIAHEPKEAREAIVTFDLPGLSGVEALVTMEHDHFLDMWMGSMVIHLTALHRGATTLTESNLQNLPSSLVFGQTLQSGHALVGLQSRPRSERSHLTRSSSYYSSHSSSPTRSSRLGRSQRSATHSGAISEMYQLHEVRFTKSFHDFAQVGSRCQRFHFRTVSDSIESNFSVIYGASIPFFIREHYRPPPAPTHMPGIFAKSVSIPGGIPGGSLLQLPSAIVDVAMTADGEAEALIIYSCLAGLKVLDALPANMEGIGRQHSALQLMFSCGSSCVFSCYTVALILIRFDFAYPPPTAQKISTRSREAPDTAVEQLIQRAISRGVDLEQESMTRVRHSDCPAWVPSTVFFGTWPSSSIDRFSFDTAESADSLADCPLAQRMAALICWIACAILHIPLEPFAIENK
eukprot:s1778_g8.t1